MPDQTPDVVHQWRITGQPDGGYPPYDYTWSSSDPRWLGEVAELCARGFLHRVTPAWTDVTFTHRTVTYSSWETADQDGDTAIPPGVAPDPDADADTLRRGLRSLRLGIEVLRADGQAGMVGDLELAIRIREERLAELEADRG